MSFLARILAHARDLRNARPGGGLFGGPLGALIEHAIEQAAQHLPHWPHGALPEGANGNGDPRRRVAFTIAVIALGAKMARADGAVTDAEIAAFGEVFQVPPGEEGHVRLVFDLARKSTLGFESYARQVGHMFAGDRAVLENLLGGLFHIALADGRLSPAEDAYLAEVARHFGLDEGDYARLRAHHVGGAAGEEDPFAILGLAPGAGAQEIRAAYHRLARDSHPDLAIAQGLPPECIALATARMARINAAYDRLAAALGAGLHAQAARTAAS